jgi:kinesin family protein 5
LTRILQESIGGNSRTTLIINCCPSLFNESETISTLRFGTRAKSIKNKIHINVEVSPKELQIRLKKANILIGELQSSVLLAQVELSKWRNGAKVDESDYCNYDLPIIIPAEEDPLLSDEREEFIRIENELADILSEKETLLKNQNNLIDSLMEQVEYFKLQDSESSKRNKILTGSLNEYKLLLEKVQFEQAETLINLDTIKESKTGNFI